MPHARLTSTASRSTNVVPRAGERAIASRLAVADCPRKNRPHCHQTAVCPRETFPAGTDCPAQERLRSPLRPSKILPRRLNGSSRQCCCVAASRGPGLTPSPEIQPESDAERGLARGEAKLDREGKMASPRPSSVYDRLEQNMANLLGGPTRADGNDYPVHYTRRA